MMHLSDALAINVETEAEVCHDIHMTRHCLTHVYNKLEIANL